MKVRIVLVAALLVLAPAGALAIPHATTPITVQTHDSLLPSGSFIRIRMLQTISSSFSQAGDRFSWVVSDDVIVGKRVVIPAGTQGNGKIDKVSPAHGGGTPGWLRLKFDSIKLTDGSEINVAITKASAIYDQNEKNGYAPAIETVATMTIPGLFILDALRKGDDMTIRQNAVFHLATTEDAFVMPEAVAVSATPVPPPVSASAGSAPSSSTTSSAAPAPESQTPASPAPTK